MSKNKSERFFHAIFRGSPEDRAVREAFEELRDWAIDDLRPMVGAHIRKKVREVANRHGVKEGSILRLLSNPPKPEPRQNLIDFLYDAVFAR